MTRPVPFRPSLTPIPSELLAQICHEAYLDSSWRLLATIQQCSKDAWNICNPFMEALLVITEDGIDCSFDNCILTHFGTSLSEGLSSYNDRPFNRRQLNPDILECVVFDGHPSEEVIERLDEYLQLVHTPRLNSVVFSRRFPPTIGHGSLESLFRTLESKIIMYHICSDCPLIDRGERDRMIYDPLKPSRINEWRCPSLPTQSRRSGGIRNPDPYTMDTMKWYTYIIQTMTTDDAFAIPCGGLSNGWSNECGGLPRRLSQLRGFDDQNVVNSAYPVWLPVECSVNLVTDISEGLFRSGESVGEFGETAKMRLREWNISNGSPQRGLFLLKMD